MELKKIIEEIKLRIGSEEVKNKIALDRLLKLSNQNKCLCFKHSESNPSMSFDSKGKKFKCFSCGANVDIFDHYQEYYNLSFIEAIKSIVRDFNLNIDIYIDESDRKPKKAPTAHEKYSKKVLDYCNKRGMSKETLDYVGIKEKNGNVCFEYRNELGEHIANKYRFTSKGAKMKMCFETDTNINSLFNMDKVDITKPLLITEGEFDALAAIEAGFKNTVSIPSGVNSTNQWISTNWDFLEQFDEIIIWFDNDEPGIKGAREAFNRCSNRSVKMVMCSLANDINEVLYKFGKKEVLNQIEKAYAPLTDGVVTLDMVEDFDVYEAEKVETGIDAIDDEILGMLFGSLDVFTGRNGAGKSTIINQIYLAEAIGQGYNCFLASAELIPGQVKEWILRTMANESDLVEREARGKIYKTVSKEGKRKLVDKLKERLYLYDSDDYNVDTLLHKMDILARRYNVKVHIVDNLMMMEGPGTDKYAVQSNIIRRFKAFAKRNNALVHMVAHPRKTMNNEVGKDDISGTADITNLSDYVTTLERNFEKTPEQNYDAKFSVIKNRHTGVNASVALNFNMDRKRFYSSASMKELNVDYFDTRFTQVDLDNFEW